MGTICEECPHRLGCTNLCEKAEKIVNQDHVKRDYCTISRETMEQYSRGDEVESCDDGGDEFSLIGRIHFTRREKQLITLLLRGYTRKEIAQRLNITRLCLRGIIHRLRAKALQKNS